MKLFLHFNIYYTKIIIDCDYFGDSINKPGNKIVSTNMENITTNGIIELQSAAGLAQRQANPASRR